MSEIKRAWKRAYEMGLKHHVANGNERPSSDFYHSIPDQDLEFIGNMGPITNAFYESGARNAELPTWSSGARYGSIPEDGVSRNWTDGRSEIGVSMANVEGNSFQWYPMAKQSRLRKYEGWLLDHNRLWGADGEPLMVGLREKKALTADAAEKAERTNGAA